MKSDVSVRKAGQLRRRAELASAKVELSKSQTVAPEPADKSIKRTAHRWDILHSKTAEARLFLCREAAQLYHLEQHKRRKGSSEKDVYTIGGVPIPDLMELNRRCASYSTILFPPCFRPALPTPRETYYSQGQHPLTRLTAVLRLPDAQIIKSFRGHGHYT